MKQEELPWHIFLRTWNTRWQFLQLYKHISHKTGRKHLTFLFNLWPQCNNFQRISSESLISLPQLLFKEKRPRKQLPVTLVGPEMNISLWCSTFCFHNTSSHLCLVYFENTTLLFFFVFFYSFQSPLSTLLSCSPRTLSKRLALMGGNCSYMSKPSCK